MSGVTVASDVVVPAPQKGRLLNCDGTKLDLPARLSSAAEGGSAGEAMVRALAGMAKTPEETECRTIHR